MNRKDWLSTVICIDHFEEKFITRGKKRGMSTPVLWQLHPVPTIIITQGSIRQF